MLFAYRTTRIACNIFTNNKPKTIVDLGMIEKETIEDAYDYIFSRSSIAAIADGVSVEIVPVVLWRK